MKLAHQIEQVKWQIARIDRLLKRYADDSEMHKHLKQDQSLWRYVLVSLEELQTAREDPDTLIGAQATRIEQLGKKVGRLQCRIHQQRQEFIRHGIEPPKEEE